MIARAITLTKYSQHLGCCSTMDCSKSKTKVSFCLFSLGVDHSLHYTFLIYMVSEFHYLKFEILAGVGFLISRTNLIFNRNIGQCDLFEPSFICDVSTGVLLFYW